MDDLQALSRRAAACLPDDLCVALRITKSLNDGIAPESSWVSVGTRAVTVGHGYLGRVWLHESTEACTEIMVRVLWPNHWDINGYYFGPAETHGAAIWPACDSSVVVTNDGDPMLAYRVAVLRALTTLNAPDGR